MPIPSLHHMLRLGGWKPIPRWFEDDHSSQHDFVVGSRINHIFFILCLTWPVGAMHPHMLQTNVFCKCYYGTCPHKGGQKTVHTQNHFKHHVCVQITKVRFVCGMHHKGWVCTQIITYKSGIIQILVTWCTLIIKAYGLFLCDTSSPKVFWKISEQDCPWIISALVWYFNCSWGSPRASSVQFTSAG